MTSSEPKMASLSSSDIMCRCIILWFNLFLVSEMKLTRAPIEDEVVLADYSGEYYRARVTKADAEGEPLRLIFVDFGDFKNIDENTKIFAVNDELKEVR
jgi:hypothetical protein